MAGLFDFDVEAKVFDDVSLGWDDTDYKLETTVPPIDNPAYAVGAWGTWTATATGALTHIAAITTNWSGSGGAPVAVVGAAFNGTTSQVKISATPDAGKAAFAGDTIMALVKTTDLSLNHAFLSAETNSNVELVEQLMEGTTAASGMGSLFVPATGGSHGASPFTANVWMLYGHDKVSGNTVPRHHSVVASVGTWTHAPGQGTNISDTGNLDAGSEWYIGSEVGTGEFWTGEIAFVAWWSGRRLTDAEYVGVLNSGTVSLAAILALSPTKIWYDLTTTQANEVSRTAITTGTSSPLSNDSSPPSPGWTATATGTVSGAGTTWPATIATNWSGTAGTAGPAFPSPITFADDFNRANTTAVAGALGAAWDNNGQFYISSNAATAPVGNSWARCQTALGPDQYSEADVNPTGGNFLVLNVRAAPHDNFSVYQGYLDPNGANAEIGKNIGGSYTTLSRISYTHGGACRVRLEVQGSTIRLYRNGMLVMSFTDTSPITTGNYAGFNSFMPSTASGSFDNFACGSLLSVYTDDFNRADGALGTPWATINVDAWTSPAIVSGHVEPTTSGLSASAYYDVSLGLDHWAEADVTIAATGSGNSAGVTVRGNNSDQIYAWIDLSPMQISLWRHQSGNSYTQLGSYVSIASMTGKIRVEAQGSAIRLYWNDVLVLTTSDTTLTGTKAGQLDFWNSGTGAKPILDNFRCGVLPYTPISTLSTRHWGASTDDIKLAAGGLATMDYGPSSHFAVIKIAHDNNTLVGGAAKVIASLRNSSDSLASGLGLYWYIVAGTSGGGFSNVLELDANPGVSNTPGQPIVVTAADEWCVVGWTKPNGTNLVRWHKRVLSTGAVTHGDGNGTVADLTPIGTGGFFHVGHDPGGEVMDGDIGAVAVWNRVLTDAEIDSLAVNYDNWIALAPVAFPLLSQTSTATPVVDLVGTSNQISVTGTSVVPTSSPLGFVSPPITPPVSLGHGDLEGSGTISKAITGINATAGKRLLLAISNQTHNNTGGSAQMAFTVSDNIGDTGGTAWTPVVQGIRAPIASGSWTGNMEWWTRMVGTTPGSNKAVTINGVMNGATTSDTLGIFFDVIQVDGDRAPRGKVASPLPAAGTTTTLSLTLDQTPLADSIVLSVVQDWFNYLALIPPTGFTTLNFSNNGGGTGPGAGHTAFKKGSAANPHIWSTGTATNLIGAAIELALSGSLGWTATATGTVTTGGGPTTVPATIATNWSPPGSAAGALVNKINAAGGSPTSSAIDTTGATFLAMFVSSSQGTVTPSDSKGNTWVPGTVQGHSGTSAQWFWVVNPTVGTGHTFSVSASFATMQCYAFSGVPTTTPYDTISGAESTSFTATTAKPGSVTPANADNLCLVGFDYQMSAGAPAMSIDSGFTIGYDIPLLGGINYAGASAYRFATSAAATNPLWSWTGGATANGGISMVAFKANAAASTTGWTATATGTVTAGGGTTWPATIVTNWSGGDSTVFSDDFNRADTATGFGSNWSDNLGWSINSGIASRDGGSNDFATYLGAMPSNDVYVEADITTAGLYYTVLNARGNVNSGTVSNCYMGFVIPGGVEVEIGKNFGGSYSTISRTNIGATTPTNYRGRLEVQGSTIRFYINGVLKATTTDTSYATGPYVGFNASASVLATIDNFVCGSLAAGWTAIANGTVTAPAAWTITELANYDEGATAAANKTTGSLVIPANSIVFVMAGGTDDGSTQWSASLEITVSDSVNGTTGWTPRGTYQKNGGGAFRMAGQLFSREFVSGATIAITVDRAGSAQAYWGYDIFYVQGYDSAAPIVQTISASTDWSDAGDAHSQAITFGAAPTSGNLVIATCIANNDAAGAKSVPTGYSTLINPSAAFQATATFYHQSTTGTTVTISDLGEDIEGAVMFGVELKVAGGGGGGATASPAAMSVVMTMPLVQAQAGQTTSPAVTTVLVTMPAAQARAGQTASPAVLNAIVTMPAVTTGAGATTSPSFINVLVAMPAVQPRASSTLSPAVLNAVVTMPGVTAGAGVVTSPGVATVIVTMPAVAGSGGGSASPAALPVIITMPAVSTAGGTSATASPAVLNAVVTMPLVTIQFGRTISPAVLPVLVTMPLSTQQAGWRVSPAVLNALVTLPGVATGGGAIGVPAVLPAVVSMPAATAQSGSTVSPAILAALVTLPAVTAGVSKTISPAPMPAVVTMPLPQARAGQTATVAVLVAPITMPLTSPAGASNATASPAVIQTVVTMPAASPRSGSSVAIATCIATITMPAPSIIAQSSRTVSPAPVNVVISMPSPSIVAGGSSTVNLGVLLVQAIMQAVTVQRGATVFPAPIAVKVSILAVDLKHLSRLKRWNGSAWVKVTPKAYDPDFAQWVIDGRIKGYDPSAHRWVSVLREV